MTFSVWSLLGNITLLFVFFNGGVNFVFFPGANWVGVPAVRNTLTKSMQRRFWGYRNDSSFDLEE